MASLWKSENYMQVKKRYKIIVSVVIIGAMSALLIGQDTIPFTLNEQNNIVISAAINSSDTVKLIFHTAVSGVSPVEES